MSQLLGSSAPYRILLVCTGNICRSPTAALLLGTALGPSVEAASAGTYALAGAGIAEPMAVHLREQGVDSTHFVARQLSEDQVRGADLVLAMTRGHRAASVEVWPASVRRAFTLREFARLLHAVDGSELPDGVPAARLAASVPLASAQRHQLKQPTELDDIADPYRGSAADYLSAFTEIDEAVRSIAASVSVLTTAVASAASPVGSGPPSPVGE